MMAALLPSLTLRAWLGLPPMGSTVIHMVQMGERAPTLLQSLDRIQMLMRKLVMRAMVMDC